MTKKNMRQNTIMEIIAGELIDTQELLTARLLERGFRATQATISRDIKEMRLIKTPLEFGGSRYTAPSSTSGSMSSANVSERLRRIFAQSALSFAQAQNLIVVKTMPGAAQTACEAVDTMGMPEIVGTLAGDNTFVIIVRDSDSAPVIMDRLRMMRGGEPENARRRHEPAVEPDE
ncbi:MAG: arginine repressor [Oscillospiraceae bacterium]|jgi:transcriptional regulator of arginine metabolism|nr:arginine repressor [Oscillospiraceae bacterium]